MPATWVALDDDPATGYSIPVALLELEARTLDVRTCHVGPTPPASPTAGMLWLDNTASPYALWVYAKDDAGAAHWCPVGPLSRLPASICADPDITDGRAAPYEYKALRPENVAALSTPTATNAGLLEHRTTDGEMWYADQPISGGSKGLLSVTAAASYDTVDFALEGDIGNDATHPPTKTLSGVLEGWLFDATNEKRTLAFMVPKNYQGASDAKLRLHQVLAGAQTGGDDIEWSGEIRTLMAAADKTGKAATALVDAVTDIGADTEGIDAGGGPHLTTLTLDFDDATNPLAAGCLVLVTVWRKTVGGAGKVGGVIVFRAELAYAQKPRHERA